MATAVAIATAVVVSAAFANGFVRLRRRGRRDLAGWDRAALFALAVVLWLFALSPPVDALANRLLAAHMLEHVLIADAAPALVLVAIRGPLCFFLLPRAVLRRLARVSLLRAAAGALLRPSVAFVVYATSIAVWHVPALYDAALESPALHGLEHASFVLGGVLVWFQLIDPARRGVLGPRQRLAYVLPVFLVGQMLANALILTYSPLYPAYAEQVHRPFGFSALGDQDLAGLIMTGEQVLTLGTFVAIQLRVWFAMPLAEPSAERHPLTV
ncbi:MAG: cytochrome c oxidase assembly protein [Gaiellaceae bacterium]